MVLLTGSHGCTMVSPSHRALVCLLLCLFFFAQLCSSAFLLLLPVPPCPLRMSLLPGLLVRRRLRRVCPPPCCLMVAEGLLSVHYTTRPWPLPHCYFSFVWACDWGRPFLFCPSMLLPCSLGLCYRSRRVLHTAPFPHTPARPLAHAVPGAVIS